MRKHKKIVRELCFILLLFVSLSVTAFSEDTDAGDSTTAEIGMISADTSSPTTDDDEANPAENTELMDGEATKISITSADTSAPTVSDDEASHTENTDAGDRKGHSYSNRGILPPNFEHGGLTYGEWNAEWWKWAFSMPTDANPLYDTADSSAGQPRDAYFLGASFEGSELGPGEFMSDVDREITIPAGTWLFIPVFNIEGSTVEGYGEGDELASNVQYYIDNDMVTDMSVTIDGKPVENLELYRSPSPVFEFGPLPDDNVLQDLGFPNAVEGTTSDAAADGYYLMLAPLHRGEHTITFTSTLTIPREDGSSFVYAQDVTYQITVVPRGAASKNEDRE